MRTRLIGHAPHIAPKAYVHVLYAPINNEMIEEFSKRLEIIVPSQLCAFLELANGMMIFSGAIRVLGYVPLERNTDGIHNYPSSIIVPNVSARIKGLSDEAVIVGWYKNDGSYVSIEADGRTVRFNSLGDGKLIQQWPDFDSWLFSEVQVYNKKYKT